MTWTTLRTFTNQVAEGANAPDPSAFVVVSGMDRLTGLEVALENLSVTGGASEFKISIWRLSEGRTHRIHYFTWYGDYGIDAFYIGCIGDKIAAKIESITGGTAPTASGTIVVRPFDPLMSHVAIT